MKIHIELDLRTTECAGTREQVAAAIAAAAAAVGSGTSWQTLPHAVFIDGEKVGCIKIDAT